MLKGKKLVIMLVSTGLIVAAIGGSYKIKQDELNQRKAETKVEVVQPLEISTKSVEELGKERYLERQSKIYLAYTTFDEARVLSDYMSSWSDPKSKEQYVEDLYGKIKTGLSEDVLNVLDKEDRVFVEKTLSSWKNSDWSNTKNQSKKFLELRDKYYTYHF